jgi:hypothetical protein
MSYLSSSIPVQVGYLDVSFLHNAKPRTINEWLPVEMFSVVSIPKRCLMFNVMSEFGAQFARVPIHYLTGFNYGTVLVIILQFRDLIILKMLPLTFFLKTRRSM